MGPDSRHGANDEEETEVERDEEREREAIVSE